MDVCITACYYTDVDASGHGFYTVQSRNEAYKATKQCKISQKNYGQTRGGAASPLNTPLGKGKVKVKVRRFI